MVLLCAMHGVLSTIIYAMYGVNVTKNLESQLFNLPERQKSDIHKITGVGPLQSDINYLFNPRAISHVADGFPRRPVGRFGLYQRPSSGGVLDRLVPGNGVSLRNAVIRLHHAGQSVICYPSLRKSGVMLRNASHATRLPRPGLESVTTGAVLNYVHGVFLSTGLLPDRRAEVL
ncbi:MAG: hypothetical protein AAGU23_02645 [Bacillota bacterium]